MPLVDDVTDLAGVESVCKLMDIGYRKNPTSVIVGAQEVYFFHVHPAAAMLDIKRALRSEVLYKTRQL